MTVRGLSLESWYNMTIKIMGLVVYNVAWAEAYVRTKWHLDSSNRLVTVHGPKSGGCCAPFGSSWIPM